MTSDQTLTIVRTYHDAWTRKSFDEATRLLSPTLIVEVPVNDYPTKETFAEALRGFGAMVTRVDLLSEMSAGDQAMLLYDMDVDRLGSLRVTEHFTVAAGMITRLRQIHDTAPVRAAGFVSAGA